MTASQPWQQHQQHQQQLPTGEPPTRPPVCSPQPAARRRPRAQRRLRVRSQAGAAAAPLQPEDNAAAGPGNDSSSSSDRNSSTSSSALREQLLRLLPDPLVLYWPVIKRLCVTVAMLAIIRMGYFIPLPGVDMQALPSATASTEGGCARRRQRRQLPRSFPAARRPSHAQRPRLPGSPRRSHAGPWVWHSAAWGASGYPHPCCLLPARLLCRRAHGAGAVRPGLRAASRPV